MSKFSIYQNANVTLIRRLERSNLGQHIDYYRIDTISNSECVARGRDGIGQNFLDPTGKFQNLRRSTGFFTGFCSLFNASDEKFLKGGPWVRC